MVRYIIKTEINGEFIFNLKLDDGQTILTSEMFRAKDDCINGNIFIQNNCTYYSRYIKKVTSNKKHFFNLNVLNGQGMGKSEMLDSVYNMEISIESVRKNGTSKTVVDE